MRSRQNKRFPVNFSARLREQRASVLPFVVIGLPVIVVFLATSIDFTRNVGTVRKLQFAADTAGLYISSCMTNADGSYTPSTVVSNMQAALSDVNGNGGAWNTAPAGQANNPQSSLTDVTFGPDDLAVVPNPADSSENFVELTARRVGNQALQQFFAPAMMASAALTGQGNIAQQSISPRRITEVIGQPASRIGAAQSWTQAAGNARAFAPFAVFPLAISNKQFAAAAAIPNNTQPYVCDLVSPATVSTASQPNHIKACFVNVAASSITGQAYGPNQGNAAIDQLTGMFKYFYPQPDSSAILPAAVERGANLPVFNPADVTFQNRQPTAALSKLTQPWLILPVIAADPSFNGTNQVVGFARMQFVTASPSSITFRIGPSVPLRNVAASNWSTIPTYTGATLPAPVFSFTPRTYNAADNSVSVRPSGVVLAAALSPRKVSP